MDAFWPATSELIVATKSANRYFDLDAVREPNATVLSTTGKPAPRAKYRNGQMPSEANGTHKNASTGARGDDGKTRSAPNPAGVPPLDWWLDDGKPFERTYEGNDVTSRFIVGDTREVLAAMPDNSVDLIISSPPFLALRSYLPADHPDKDKEIGSEATPGAFLDTLLDIVEECARVLAPHGSLCIELGDTYSGSGGAGGDYSDDGLRAGQNGFDGSGRRSRSGWDRLGKRATQDDQPPNYRKAGTISESFTPNGGAGWPEAKSLCLIPQSFAWALSYGRNPFTGRETERWRVRNIVRWCRPNPPVGALGDKFRPATSEMVVACKARDRYFDLDSVRTEFVGDGISWGTPTLEQGGRDTNSRKHHEARSGVRRMGTTVNTHAGAPPLDWWEIPTQPYKSAHYATFPEKLVVKPIKSMCPERVCTVCGEPSRRIVEADYGGLVDRDRSLVDRGNSVPNPATNDADRVYRGETLGWSDCECEGGDTKWRRGIVLDIFAGSGTTLAVAEGLGRDSIGIDLDQRNAELARERCGMFLEVVSLEVSDDLSA